MSSLVFFVVLGSALLHASWNAIIKGGTNKLFETALHTGGGGVVALCLLLFLPPPAPASWPYLAASCSIQVLYYTSMAYAYARADLGYAYTIMRGFSPLLTSLVAVFVLHDTLSTNGWLGIALLSVGILTLAADSLHRGAIPWKVTFTALGSAVVIMGFTVVDGSGVRLAENTFSYVCWVFFLNALPQFAIVYVTQWQAYLRYARTRWQYGLFGGACSVLAYGSSLWAMTKAPIATVAALRETSVLFGMLLGVCFLHERFTPARVVATILVLAGALSSKLLA